MLNDRIPMMYRGMQLESPVNALQQVLQVQGQQQGNALQRLQMQNFQQQQADRMAQAQRQQAIEGAYRNALETPLQQAGAAGMTRPTPANAAALGQMQPRVNQQKLVSGLMQADPMAAYGMLQPKPADYKVVGDALLQIGPGGVTEAYKGAPKPAALPAAVQEYEYAKGQGYKGSFEQWDTARRRAGAASTSVSYGTPVQAIDAQGNPVFIQPTKDGSPANVIPGVRPPMSAAEERAGAEKRDRARQGQQMMSAMSDARTILQAGRATESGVGNMADSAARMVGQTTKGAQDAARLEALSGWLVANVPRMEGPQSNFDVANYTTMAGKIGDRTVPIAERLAALSEVEKLQRKYAAINGTPAAESAPTEGKVRRFNPATGKIE